MPIYDYNDFLWVPAYPSQCVPWALLTFCIIAFIIIIRLDIRSIMAITLFSQAPRTEVTIS